MEQVLLVVQVLLAVGLIGLVLIQRSDSDGFGLSGGSGSNLLSGRSSANLMTRTTAIFAALFMLNALVLSVMASRGHTSSIAETIVEEQSKTPSVPAVPLAGAKSEKKAAAKPANAEADATEKTVAEDEKPVAKKAAKKAKPADAEENGSEDHN